MGRRPSGSGSIYYRSDGFWIARFRHHGQEVKVAAKTREAVIERLAARGITWQDAPAGPPTRAELLAAARERDGAHTEVEWLALCAASPRECRYCGVRINALNSSKDHRIPLQRGGSDLIENIDRICWECNMEKGDRTPEEFTYTGPRPRPFAIHPRRRRMFAEAQAKAAARG